MPLLARRDPVVSLTVLPGRTPTLARKRAYNLATVVLPNPSQCCGAARVSHSGTCARVAKKRHPEAFTLQVRALPNAGVDLCLDV